MSSRNIRAHSKKSGLSCRERLRDTASTRCFSAFSIFSFWSCFSASTSGLCLVVVIVADSHHFEQFEASPKLQPTNQYSCQLSSGTSRLTFPRTQVYLETHIRCRKFEPPTCQSTVVCCAISEIRRSNWSKY
jgi:hypothetical protein